MFIDNKLIIKKLTYWITFSTKKCADLTELRALKKNR